MIVNKFRILTIAALASLAVLTVDCKKSDRSGAMVVIFASSQSTITRDGQTLPAKPGFVLRTEDIIETKAGSLDVQTSNGSALRIREFTKIRLSNALAGTAGTTVELKSGSLIANVQRNKEGFNVVMPTSIASVRGTTFSAEVGKENSVKVLEGSVAMTPRVPALEKLSAEDIQNNPALKNLAENLAKQEVVLEEKTVGVQDAATIQALNQINTQVQSSPPASVAEIVVPASTVETRTVQITPQEEAESATLVTVDETLVNKAMEATANASPAEQNSRAAELEKQISQQHSEHLNQAVTVIEEKAQERGLKTEKEIQTFYNVLEVVVKRDGSKESGAVVAQAGEIIVLHSAQGVLRLNKLDIDYIDYFHNR